MEELKNKIIELRKRVTLKDFCVSYDEEKEYALKQEIFDLMRKEPNKEELTNFWNKQFTGNYDG